MYNAVAHQATNEQRDSYICFRSSELTSLKWMAVQSQTGPKRQTRLVSSETQVAPLHPLTTWITNWSKKADEQGAAEHEVALQSFGAVICFSPTNL